MEHINDKYCEEPLGEWIRLEAFTFPIIYQCSRCGSAFEGNHVKSQYRRCPICELKMKIVTDEV